MTIFIELLAYGIVAGALYAMVVLGYSLVYSVLGFVNFSHGEMLTVGVYLCWLLGPGLGLSLPFAIGISAILTGAISFLIGRWLLVPARNRSTATALVLAIGVSIVIQNVLALLFEPDAKPFYTSKVVESIIIAGILFKPVHIISLFSSVVLLFLTWSYFLKRTDVGLEIRASASNATASYIYGLRRMRVFGIIFFLNGVFAALAGAAVAYDDHIITPTMGFSFGLRAFVASVIGGIGSLRGAVVGAFVLGITESLVTFAITSIPILSWLSPLASKDVIAFGLLAVVLAWKPAGLFARQQEPRP